MAKNYTERPLNQIRYTKRIVEDEGWIKELLHRIPTGSIATVYEGQPFVMTNLFVYDEADNAIYMHTAQVGRTRDNVEQAEKVCFTVMEMGRLLPYEEAVNFDVEYASVVVFGRATMIEDIEEKRRMLQMIMDKYAPQMKLGRDYPAMSDADLKRTSVYRIKIEQWSGKKNEQPDHPGAYVYGAQG